MCALEGNNAAANLLFERYVRKIRRPDWTTAVTQAVGRSHACAVSLVELFLDYRAFGAARKWADQLGVTSEDVPALLGLAEEEEEEEEEDCLVPEPSDRYLDFPLRPHEDIWMVEDEEALIRAVTMASVSSAKLAVRCHPGT